MQFAALALVLVIASASTAHAQDVTAAPGRRNQRAGAALIVAGSLLTIAGGALGIAGLIAGSSRPAVVGAGSGSGWPRPEFWGGLGLGITGTVAIGTGTPLYVQGSDQVDRARPWVANAVIRF